MGLDPISQPARRGTYYILHAYDPSGIEVRVVADAQFGDVLSVVPARTLNNFYAPHYQRGPRIIHVPQAGANDSRDESSLSDDDDETAAVPAQRDTAPPRHPTTQRRPLRSDTPLSNSRRTVLSAPATPSENLTPIPPIPPVNPKTGGDKFAPPREITSNPPPPPVGYTPPAAVPQPD